MTAAPTLEDLRDSPRPAWLWDAARRRVVWANVAGIAAIGDETLFDLLDRPFDESLPSIRKLSEILGSLKRSEHASLRLDWGCAKTRSAGLAAAPSIRSPMDVPAFSLLAKIRVGGALRSSPPCASL